MGERTAFLLIGTITWLLTLLTEIDSIERKNCAVSIEVHGLRVTPGVLDGAASRGPTQALSQGQGGKTMSRRFVSEPLMVLAWMPWIGLRVLSLTC